MTGVYSASLLLILGLIFMGHYIKSLGTTPLLTKIDYHRRARFKAKNSLSAFISLIRVRKGSKKQELDLLFQLPDFLDLLAVALSSGESAYSALTRVVPRLSGSVAKEFEKLLMALEYGSDFETELSQISRNNPSNPLSELANRLLLAMRRGTPLSQMLFSQAAFVRQDLQNQLLKQSGRNETRMLFPLVFMILPVTILFAIFPSLEMLGGSYI